ncbi:MAG: S10 family peptidase, partial [Deltaproteobacteria bacterium]
GGARTAANPYSFTKLGNLLYLDAPNTGFSYNMTQNVEIEAVRKAEFGARNFNTFIDAAQMTRALLMFLAEHPSIKSNQVILVGESYGGVRASIMLNLLLFHSRYAGGSAIYRDSALADLIRAHFLSAGLSVPPQTVARQFAGQILISPLLAGQIQDDLAGGAYEEAGSVIFQIAAMTGTTFTPCAGAGCEPTRNALDFVIETAKRDIYQYDQPAGYINDLLASVLEGLNTPSILSSLFSRSLVDIPGLGAVHRRDAYRYVESREKDAQSVIGHRDFARLPSADQIRIRQRAARLSSQKDLSIFSSGPTLPDVLGTLNLWDNYILDCNDQVLETFYANDAIDSGYTAIDPLDAAMGELFLQNLALVKTFITNAKLDLVIYTPVIPETLKKYTAIVQNVVWHDVSDNGFIAIDYQPGSLPDIPTPDRRIIYFPRYPLAGHMVTHAQPDKFFADVQMWLAAPQ